MIPEGELHGIVYRSLKGVYMATKRSSLPKSEGKRYITSILNENGPLIERKMHITLIIFLVSSLNPSHLKRKLIAKCRHSHMDVGNSFIKMDGHNAKGKIIYYCLLGRTKITFAQLFCSLLLHYTNFCWPQNFFPYEVSRLHANKATQV